MESDPSQQQEYEQHGQLPGHYVYPVPIPHPGMVYPAPMPVHGYPAPMHPYGADAGTGPQPGAYPAYPQPHYGYPAVQPTPAHYHHQILLQQNEILRRKEEALKLELEMRRLKLQMKEKEEALKRLQGARDDEASQSPSMAPATLDAATNVSTDTNQHDEQPTSNHRDAPPSPKQADSDAEAEAAPEELRPVPNGEAPEAEVGQGEVEAEGNGEESDHYRDDDGEEEYYEEDEAYDGEEGEEGHEDDGFGDGDYQDMMGMGSLVDRFQDELNIEAVEADDDIDYEEIERHRELENQRRMEKLRQQQEMAERQRQELLEQKRREEEEERKKEEAKLIAATPRNTSWASLAKMGAPASASAPPVAAADGGWTSAAAAKRPAAPPAQVAGAGRPGAAIQCPPAGRYMGKTANFQPIYTNVRYNPAVYDLKKPNARFFVIKSIGEDDVHKSVKYKIWASTTRGNHTLNRAYHEQNVKGGPLYLFFSVNGSGHFCGIARMSSEVDFDTVHDVWASHGQYKGSFEVEWLYVKDVPNGAFKHLFNPMNENKCVTHSRDCQEINPPQGYEMMKLIHTASYKTCLLEDFSHYDEREEKMRAKRP